MIFRIVFVDLKEIFYNFSFYQDIEEVLDYGIEYINLEKRKSIDYLFAILQITKYLPEDIKADILYRSLITEFKERFFIEKFDRLFFEDLSEELDFLLYISYSSDHTNYSLESFYYSE